MKKYFYFILAIVFAANATNAQVRKDTALLMETFETNSSTVGDWGVASPTCGSSDVWQIYSGTAAGANGSDRFVAFPGSSASSGCSQILYSPQITINKKTNDDSIKVGFWIYRTTSTTSDYVDLYILDDVGIAEGPVRVYQYYLQSPASSTGWVQLFWRMSYASLSTTSNSIDVYFAVNAVSGAGADLRIDDVKVEQIWREKAAPKLEIVFPSGGQLTAGRTFYSLAWRYAGSSATTDPVKVEYSLDGGDTWSTIVTSDGSFNSYPWDAPVTETEEALIRVTDVSDPTMTATSKPFSIIWPIDLTSQNNGDTVGIGRKIPITWTRAADVFGLDIEFSSDGGANWTIIAENVSAGAGSYLWTVPSILTNNAMIRITDLDGASLSDESDKPFSIILPLKLHSPNGGEKVGSGYQVPVVWQNIGGVSKVKILFTVNGGVQWNEVATNIDASAGTYLWTVPNVPSATVKVRVSDMADADVYEESDAYFSIYDATAIEENDLSLGFACYPNPSNGKIIIRSGSVLSEPAVLSVVDLAGRNVYNSFMQTGAFEKKLDLSHLGAGMYSLIITSNHSMLRQTIVIQSRQ